MCREKIDEKYSKMMEAEPIQEMQDYVLQIGVRNNSTLTEAFENFHGLFKDKTEELVSWLFEELAPFVRQEVAKIEGKPAHE